MDSLVQSLLEARVKNIDSRHFIPDDALERILSSEAIHHFIQNTAVEVYHRREIIDAIANGGKHLFAVLALMGEESSLLNFIERDQMVKTYDLDSRLPLTLEDLRKILPTGTAASLFYEKQWELLAPFFREDKSHRVFDEDTVFPFIGCEGIAEGGFGEISKVTLNEAHHGFTSVAEGKVTAEEQQVDKGLFAYAETGRSGS